MGRIGYESESLEFKKSSAELEKGIVSLTAMLNKNGFGEVLFGVDDNGEVVGQDIGSNTIRKISQTIHNYVDPEIIASINIVDCGNGKKYISVKADGHERPYAYDHIVYIRSGEEDRKAPMSELRMMLKTSRDNLIDSLSNNQDLTFDGLTRMLDRKNVKHGDKGSMIWSMDLKNSGGKYNIQGQLLSDQNPAILTVVIFSGTDRTFIQHRKDFSGNCILDLVEAVNDYVISLNQTSVKIVNRQRIDQEQFDPEAFGEAWINACVHNDWLGCTPPTVHIFDDRMEIISYGPKPYWLGNEDFFRGRSMPVNESFMRAFIMTGLSEHTGHGIPRITKTYGEEAFDISNSGIKVTLRFAFVRLSAGLKKGRPVLTDNERMILDDLKLNPSMTLDDVAKDARLNRSYVGKTVMKLKNMGLLERVGSNKKGMWRVHTD